VGAHAASRTVRVSLPGLLEVAIFGGVEVPMVGQGRKWVESTRLLNPRRFLSLRDPQLDASIWTRSPKASPRPPHTSTAKLAVLQQKQAPEA